MPNADEYLEAAARLRCLARRVDHGSTLVRIVTEPGRIAGGPVATLAERSLLAVRVEVERARVEVERLAAICERRAVVCAAYAADLLRHGRVADSLGRRVAVPEPPAWWVEP